MGTNDAWLYTSNNERNYLKVDYSTGCMITSMMKTERLFDTRMVAKGCSQKEGIDDYETFAPVMKYKSLRIILAIVAIQDLESIQMGVKTAS